MKNALRFAANRASSTAPPSPASDQPPWPGISPRARVLGCVGCLLFLVVLFLGPLIDLARHALHTELDSYILLVPFISAYLLHLQAKSLPRDYASSPVWTASFVAFGLLVSGAGRYSRDRSGSDQLACLIAAFLCFTLAAGFFFLGRRWIKRAAFPLAFLIFMIPLPAPVVAWLENCSKSASAEVASFFFTLSSTPNLRDGQIFQLPNITIEVAPECSGIRSSLVLFITSLLAAHLFLRSPWRQGLLVALVIPLGFLRNGFRIWTIGQLCVYVGPHMIDSMIHRKGGPVFFALSLLPLLFLIFWLRRGENLAK